jgi:phage/plasmid-like protein (TIGR03299 family)
MGSYARLAENMPFYGSTVEAMHDLELDWNVERVPLYAVHQVEHFKTYEKVSDAYGVQRDSDGKVLGVVGSRYQTIPNQALAEATDTLIGAAGAELSGMGETHEGRRVFTVVKLDRQIVVPHLPDDIQGAFLMGTTSHDGSAMLTFRILVYRWACTNGLIGLSHEHTNSVSVRHTASWEFKLDHALGVMATVNEYLDAHERIMHRLIDRKIQFGEFDRLIEQLLPMPANAAESQRIVDRVVNRRESLRDLYIRSDNIDDTRGTGWGFVNAVAEWDQWSDEAQKRRRSTPMERLVVPSGVNYVERARDLVLA